MTYVLSIATSSFSALVASTSSTISSCFSYAFCKSSKTMPLIDFNFRISEEKKLKIKFTVNIHDNRFYILSFPFSTAIKPPWAITRTKCCAVMHSKSCCSNDSKVWILMLPLSQGSIIPAEPGRNSPPASSCMTLLYAIWMGNVCLLFNSERWA